MSEQKVEELRLKIESIGELSGDNIELYNRLNKFMCDNTYEDLMKKENIKESLDERMRLLNDFIISEYNNMKTQNYKFENLDELVKLFKEISILTLSLDDESLILLAEDNEDMIEILGQENVIYFVKKLAHTFDNISKTLSTNL